MFDAVYIYVNCCWNAKINDKINNNTDQLEEYVVIMLTILIEVDKIWKYFVTELTILIKINKLWKYFVTNK